MLNLSQNCPQKLLLYCLLHKPALQASSHGTGCCFMLVTMAIVRKLRFLSIEIQIMLIFSWLIDQLTSFTSCVSLAYCNAAKMLHP